MKQDSTAQRLLKQRYLLDGEDYAGMVDRVLEHVVVDESEQFKNDMRDIFLNRTALPNSPCLFNAGTKTGGLFACFVVGPEYDTLEDHVYTLADVAQVAKRGGGCGFTGTFIRPEGLPVAGSTHGFAYGPNAYAERVSDYLSMITQSGKRGMALMYTLPSDHADLEKFINLKQTGNEQHCHNFNQSIFASDKWMSKAINDPFSNERRLFDLAVKNIYNNGEPGFLFADTINRNTPYKLSDQRIFATNPCFHPDTMIQTVNGPKKISEITESTFVYSMDENENLCIRKASKAFVTKKNAQTYRVTLNNGNFIRATEEHKLCVHDKGWVKIKDLQEKDRIAQKNSREGRKNIVQVPEEIKYDCSVVSVKKDEIVDVYDIQVPGTNCLIADNMVAHNCGEQPLPPYGSCNLGSINVASECFTEGEQFDFLKFSEVAKNMTRFLDCVGSATTFPNYKFEKWYADNRPVGIGIMGFADLLLKLKIAYGTPESISLLSKIMETLQSATYRESEKLGVQKGVPKNCEKLGRRNITTVSIAPTGSIAILAGLFGHSIEPIYAPAFNRTDFKGETYLFEHKDSEKDYFRSAINDDMKKRVNWKQHLDIQIAAQKHCDSGVSKTINFNSNATTKEIEEAIVYAWENALKGVAIYVDGSREVQTVKPVGSFDDSLKNACPKGVCEV